MALIFLSGFTPKQLSNFVNSNSKTPPQNAADSLQLNLLAGLSEKLGSEMVCINLPFLGSFPSRFRKLFVPAVNYRLNSASIYSLDFLNLVVVKQFFRFWTSYRNINRFATPGGWVLVYSAHLPFMLAALLLRNRRKHVRVSLILPDLPEHMGAQGGIKGVLNKIGTKVFYALARRFDHFVPLTSQMIGRLGVSPECCTVMEGVASIDSVEDGNFCTQVGSKKSILYTGTLASKFGVKHLVHAFKLIPRNDVELWICGDGDARDFVLQESRVDPRIKYFGLVDRATARQMQAKATVLINPRLPGDEYTKYSFPSKIMEYMCSGRPVIMYRLEGIPGEYFDYAYSPPDHAPESLARCMVDVVLTPHSILNSKARAAYDFVYSEKNPPAQAGKLLADLQKYTNARS